MSQIDVQIMGQTYLLACPEGAEPQLRAAVGKVDEAMCKIRDTGKVKARDRIAVLAALNLAFDAKPAPHTAASGASGDTAMGDSRLLELMHKLDRALGADGQLL